MTDTQGELVRIGGVNQQSLAERERDLPPPEMRSVLFDVSDLEVAYGGNPALTGVSLDIYRNFVTAFIGPSGCGKSTFIRCFNRMNDLIPSAQRRTGRSSTTESTSTARKWIPSRYASGSGWSSRSRTRSRSRSTTTSPSARACST